MKREIAQRAGWVLLVALFVSGCYERRYQPVVAAAPTGEVVVAQTPPEPRTEVIGVAPSPQHVWVNGYWVYQNRRWVWMPGHYELRPRAGAVWIAGRWDRTAGGWVWRPGHWN